MARDVRPDLAIPGCRDTAHDVLARARVQGASADFAQRLLVRPGVAAEATAYELSVAERIADLSKRLAALEAARPGRSLTAPSAGLAALLALEARGTRDTAVRLLVSALLCAGLAAAASRPLAAADRAEGPVCNTEYLGDNGFQATAQDWNTRRYYYCPQGARSLRLHFDGHRVEGNPPLETTNPAVALTASVELDAPLPWRAGQAYGTGELVAPPPTAAWAGLNMRARRPTTTFPEPGPDWDAVTEQTTRLHCRGQDVCLVPSGQAIRTDVLPVDLAAGALLVVRLHVIHSPVATGPNQTTRAGSYQIAGSRLADLTGGGGRLPWSTAQLTVGPTAIVGERRALDTPVPSVCLLADSRGVGYAGVGVSAYRLLSGGAGFTTADLGRRLRNVDANGTPGIGLRPVLWTIQAVAGGGVTSLGVYDPGEYAQAGGPVHDPLGPQATVPLDPVGGAGVTVDISRFSYASGIYEDPATLSHGFLQIGLARAGIPFAAFSRSDDFVASWLVSSAARLDAIKQSGCSAIIIALGGNDIVSGRPATQVQAQLGQLADALFALRSVHHVHLVTVTPFASSTDRWATARNQQPAGSEAQREAFNTWIRSRPRPFSLPIDVAAALEVDADNVLKLNGARWLANGSPLHSTLDSIHLAPAAAEHAAEVVTRTAPELGR